MIVQIRYMLNWCSQWTHTFKLQKYITFKMYIRLAFPIQQERRIWWNNVFYGLCKMYVRCYVYLYERLRIAMLDLKIHAEKHLNLKNSFLRNSKLLAKLIPICVSCLCVFYIPKMTINTSLYANGPGYFAHHIWAIMCFRNVLAE